MDTILKTIGSFFKNKSFFNVNVFSGTQTSQGSYLMDGTVQDCTKQTACSAITISTVGLTDSVYVFCNGWTGTGTPIAKDTIITIPGLENTGNLKLKSAVNEGLSIDVLIHQ